MATTLVYVTYVVASVVVVLFGAAACFLTYARQGLFFLSPVHALSGMLC